MDRASFGVLIGSIAVHTVKSGYNLSPEEPWLRWYWLTVAVLVTISMLFVEGPVSRPERGPNWDVPLHRLCGHMRAIRRPSEATSWSAHWDWVRERFVWQFWSLAGWRTVLGFLGAAVFAFVSVRFMWIDSPSSTEPSEPSPTPWMYFVMIGGALLIALPVADTIYRNAKRSYEVLNRAAYQIGLSSLLTLCSFPVFLLCVFALPHATWLVFALGFLWLVVQAVLFQAGGRLRNMLGYNILVGFSTISALDLSLPVITAWNLPAVSREVEGYLARDDGQLQVVGCHRSGNTRLLFRAPPKGWDDVSDAFAKLADSLPSASRALVLPVRVVGIPVPAGMVVEQISVVNTPCVND
jgi:hypothetical protein